MLCQFGPVTVLFQNIPSHLFWTFWSWKLDPFRVESGVPDVVVDYSGQQIVPKSVPVYEKCGKVCRQIFILDEGTIIWQQKESLEGQLQMQFAVSADWSRITINQDNSPTAGMAAFEALTFLIYYVFIRKQVLTFHGAIVEEGGRGFLLCADSGEIIKTHLLSMEIVLPAFRSRENGLALVHLGAVQAENILIEVYLCRLW